jgi:hypothetical protein
MYLAFKERKQDEATHAAVEEIPRKPIAPCRASADEGVRRSTSLLWIYTE